MRYKIIITLGVTLLVWASAFAGIRAALQDYSPFHLAVSRFLVSSCLLVLLAFFNRIRLPERADLPRILLTGFFGIAAYNAALNYGEMTVTAGAASFIVNTVPIFTTLLSLFFLREQVNLFGWFGMIVSFAGVSLIAIGESGGLQLGTGAIALLCAALFLGLYSVLQKPLLAKYGAFNVVCYAIWTGTIGMFVFLPGLTQQIKAASVSSTLAVIYLGVFPSTVGYLCWSYVLSQMPASKAAVYLYLIPATAIVIAFVWLKEIPSWMSLVGGCIALCGVVIVNILGKPQPNKPLDQRQTDCLIKTAPVKPGVG